MIKKPIYQDILLQRNITPETKRETLEKALERAWAIRNFEIELYWKRALYFWGFIALCFAAYANSEEEQEQFLCIIAGLIFSFFWFYVNKASKFWQENWESHIDCLETKIEGNLYKTVLKNKCSAFNPLKGFYFSVSKINQCTNIFIISIWLILGIKNIYPEFNIIEKNKFYLFTFTTVFLLFIFPLLIKTSFKEKNKTLFKEIKNCKYSYFFRDIKK